MMYQSRVYEVRVQNTSQIRFDYQWDLKKFTTVYRPDATCPFSVEPHSGFIGAGQISVFRFRFSPDEVDDFIAEFELAMPFLSAMDPAVVRVSGLSRRPLCHIDVPMSDYISAGRRHPAYTDPLPDDVRVIEVFSRKIGLKTEKCFDVINPTSMPYEVKWQRADRSDQRIVQCLTPHALISSGKRYRVKFAYTPVSVKTVESQWVFVIHEHNITIHFLIVGRIMPS
jgi:hydrocephalus-inducing protein